MAMEFIPDELSADTEIFSAPLLVTTNPLVGELIARMGGGDEADVVVGEEVPLDDVVVVPELLVEVVVVDPEVEILPEVVLVEPEVPVDVPVDEEVVLVEPVEVLV